MANDYWNLAKPLENGSQRLEKIEKRKTSNWGEWEMYDWINSSETAEPKSK